MSELLKNNVKVINKNDIKIAMENLVHEFESHVKWVLKSDLDPDVKFNNICDYHEQLKGGIYALRFMFMDEIEVLEETKNSLDAGWKIWHKGTINSWK